MAYAHIRSYVVCESGREVQDCNVARMDSGRDVGWLCRAASHKHWPWRYSPPLSLPPRSRMHRACYSFQHAPLSDYLRAAPV
jgi:hypothetical protein